MLLLDDDKCLNTGLIPTKTPYLITSKLRQNYDEFRSLSIYKKLFYQPALKRNTSFVIKSLSVLDLV